MNSDWFSGAIIWKVEGGELMFLVQESQSIGKHETLDEIQTKFPGGVNRDHPSDKTPLYTLKREIMEEIYMMVKDGVEPERFYTSVSTDSHRKFFFLVPFNSLEGELRTEGIKDGRTYLYPPRWANASGIKVYRTHRRAAREAFKKLMRANNVLLVG